MTSWPPPGRDRSIGGRRYTFALPARAESVAHARSRTRVSLTRWNVDEETRDSAVQVISELAAQAVIHAGGDTILCELGDHGLRLYVAVHDQGVGPNSPRANPNPGPDPDPAPEWNESGCGLLIVQALSDAWGAHATGPGSGRVVWAELPYGAGL
jgi:anti-sigma regulatory factor (Ser/Thr protein kinase)